MTTLSNNNFDADSPIAFFDSGIGGLTVLNKVKKSYRMKIIYIMGIQPMFLTAKKLRNNYWIIQQIYLNF